MSPQNRNGPLYTMSGSGGQVLMNAKNIISATNIQFLPSVRAKSCSMAMDDHVKPINTFVPTLGYPLLTSIKGFFSSLIRPIIGQSNNIVADTTILTGQFATPSEYLPAANLSDNNDNNCNIYMNFMPDLTSLSFLDYDEYEHDRLDSPVDLKRFDLNDVSNVTDITTTRDDSPPSNDILSPGVDTTDFASSLAVPRFETNQIESLHPQCVDTVMEKNASQPLEKKMDLLPPAVGQTTGKMAERMTQEISHSQKTACAANGNRTKRHRRAARNNMQGSRCGSKRAVAISKNRNVKSRHELAQNIHDDLEDCTMDAHWAEDEDDDDHIDVEMVMAPTLNVSETITRPERANMIEEKRPGCIFTTFFNFGFGGRSLCKPWPMSTSKLAPYSKQQYQTTQSPRCRLKDSESDDSFIMFAEDSPKTTPTVETVLQNSMGIKGMANPFYSCMRKKAVTRQRQLSECSDDFICFEYDGDHVDNDQEDDEDDVFDNSDSESESDSDDESNFAEESESESESDIDDEHLSTGTYQPDSGFEEKKVSN